MTPAQFKAWRLDMDYTQPEAAEALGLSVFTILNYEKGFRRGTNEAVEIPRTVELACAALANDIFAYVGPRGRPRKS